MLVGSGCGSSDLLPRRTGAAKQNSRRIVQPHGNGHHGTRNRPEERPER